MGPRISIVAFFLWIILLYSGNSLARPTGPVPELVAEEPETGLVGDVDSTFGAPQKTLADTIWIADWSFDTGGFCDDTGWMHVDNRILNDGSIHWHMESSFDGTGGIEGMAAAVGHHDNACCVEPDGYANDWYQAIRIPYTTSGQLSFDYLVDTEEEYDFLQVETDSLCASFARVDYDVSPNTGASSFRSIRFTADGTVLNGSVTNLALPAYPGGGTHCVYIAFFSDVGASPCDGLQGVTIGEGAVIDDIVIVDASGTRTEDFEDGDLDIGAFMNIQDSLPFGTWARLYPDISDNDFCTENKTCAWLWSDHTTPTLYNDISMAFGPRGYVIRNWLDDIIVSPWVNLTSTRAATNTVLQFRRFPGNWFSNSRIVQSWAVRSRSPSQEPQCPSLWEPRFRWNSLSAFHWRTLTFDMTPYFDPDAEEIQIRYRTSDWQLIVGAFLLHAFPGPGPYVDRTRIGRIALPGPMISEGTDARSQAQDCFPTEVHPEIPLAAGEHHRPSTDRFGTCAFSQGADLAHRTPHLVTGDSVHVSAHDLRGLGVIAIEMHAAIVRGPHAGKAPAPWTAGSNGFFVVAADSSRDSNGAWVQDQYFVDLDDTYFRGGDTMLYFWLARDSQGGVNSDPQGLSAVPASVEQAEAATSGLFEVSFLPTIDWDPGYRARIAADAHGDLEPTTSELANSSQGDCILYVNHVNARRRSGSINRTAFMYSLDRLGYRDHYDVYDHTGMGNTNNHLGGRATVLQTQGYNLIVYDAGNRAPGTPIMPDGIDLDSQKVDQAGWFRAWLAQSPASEAGFATLWILGSNPLKEHPTNALYTTDMGAMLSRYEPASILNPEVDGVASFTFDHGPDATTVDFAADLWVAQGGCPDPRDYDGVGPVAGAVVTHAYRSPSTGALGSAALVMRRNDTAGWNTIFQSHPWFDVRDPNGSAPQPQPPEMQLMARILAGVLPLACLASPLPVDNGDTASLAIPSATVLYANVPNPFNPSTEIRYDLARSGRVKLRIYDVAGALVRTLLDADMESGFGKRLLWNGLDAAGRRVPSGLYFARLDAPARTETRKMLLLR
ncbi:MAG TPA: hypothetical protein VFE28_09465 [Candidatus Krumholzibacteria bacterium]|nr:hypothetical protein [Candidatus Krumholzibacteria bacterium]